MSEEWARESRLPWEKECAAVRRTGLKGAGGAGGSNRGHRLVPRLSVLVKAFKSGVDWALVDR
eukprot:460331-Prorocentrum_minimum.AAC.2